MKRYKFLIVSCVLLVMANAINAQTLIDAKKLLNEEQFKKSKSVLNQLSKQDPSNAEIMYTLGKVYFEDTDVDSALYFFVEAAKLAPESPFTHLAAGRVAVSKKNNEAAKDAFNKAISINKKNSDIIIEAGDAAVKEDSALVNYVQELFTKYEKVCKKNIDFYIVRGDINHLQNKGGEAVSNYNLAKEIDKNDPRPFMRTANVWQSARRYDLSIQDLEEAEKSNPNFPPLLRELGEVKFLKGDYVSAKNYYARYLTLIGNDIDAQTKYAKFLFLSKLYDKTIEQINEVLALDKSATVLYRLLGYSYFENKKYAEGLTAMEYFMKNASASTIRFGDYKYYGRLLSKNKYDSLANPVLLKAYKLDSTDIIVWYEILSTYMNTKNYKEAVIWQNKIINANKKATPLDFMKVGQIYYIAGDFKNADSVYTTVLQKSDSNNINVIIWKARCKAGLDNQEKPKGFARPYFQKILDLGKTDVTTYKKELIEANRYMGFLYFKAKKYPKALEYFRNIQQLDPAYSGNATIISQIEGILKKQALAKQKKDQETAEDDDLKYLDE